jgi:hypothetical protein
MGKDGQQISHKFVFKLKSHYIIHVHFAHHIQTRNRNSQHMFVSDVVRTFSVYNLKGKDGQQISHKFVFNTDFFLK